MTYRTLLLMPLAALLLAACAGIPQPLEGDFDPVSWDAARSGDADDHAVRWGGTLIHTEPKAEQTCFFVLAHPLDSQARPKPDADGPGRFMACKSGFYDPEVFRKGRELTVTGTLHGTIQRKIGEYEYTYPRVNADTVFLWPRRPVYTPPPPVPWSPWGGYYDPFWGPAWYPRPVIVVPQHHAPRRRPSKK